MFCTNCGKKIPDGSRFCPECGARLNVSAPSPSFQTPKVNETNQRPVGTTGSSVMAYSKWIMAGAVVLMLIGLALPVAKVSVFGMSESAHLSDFDFSDSTDRISLIFLILTMIAAAVTLVFQFLPKLKKYGNFTAIGTFVLALIYYSALYSQIKDYGEIASIGSGTVLILVGSIVLLIFGILDLVQKNKH